MSGTASNEARDELSRELVVRRLSAQTSFDVLIIGAGITGAATFRDLSLQGVRCLIVDREDFGAGATGASTRMAHGGLRYLENGELRLVAESIRERNRMLHNCAHTVSPLLVTFPTFSFFGGVAGTFKNLFRGARDSPIRSHGLFLAKLGLVLYDWLGHKPRVLPKHTLYLGKVARRLLPDLHPGVHGFTNHYDAKISHPERLAFELIADGLAANPGCLALNHCEFDRHKAGQVFLRDRLGAQEFVVVPKLIVNASGAWIDRVNRRIARTEPLIDGTKGSHLVIDNARLREAMAGRGILFDDGTGRMCIACALGEKVLLGSTDIRIDNPDEAICDDQEIEYLLGAIRLVFPFIDVRREQIKFRFSGVRPLRRSDAKDTVDISRDHSVVWREPDPEAPFPMLSLVGGKWTNFRAFAQQATDRVLAELKVARSQATEDLPIGGGKQFPTDEASKQAWAKNLANDTELAAARVEELLARYGTRARQVAAFCAAAPDVPLAEAPEYSEREIAYLVRCEMAVTLEDVIFRRTTLAMWGRIPFKLLCQLTAIAARAQGLSVFKEEELLTGAIHRLKDENGIDYLGELERYRNARAAEAERSGLVAPLRAD